MGTKESSPPTVKLCQSCKEDDHNCTGYTENGDQCQCQESDCGQNAD